MRKIIDSNILQSEVLQTYLSASRENYAVLTDYAAMEAYKGDTLQSIHRSMEILAVFSKQVIVLKDTQTICGLRGRLAGLQRRMIDEEQTRGFTNYCRDLQAARNGDRRFEKSLLALGREATVHMERLLVDARRMPKIFDDIARNYSAEVVVASVFQNHPKVSKFPPRKEFGNTYLFRFALSAYVWALRWVSVGGASGRKPEKVRNDMVDISFAVYGSFFDGLLTADARAAELHGETLWWLSALRDCLRRCTAAELHAALN